MAVKVKRKPKGAYHHPDLERALVDVAIRTIREQGVDALTLRDVGSQLGVSRTALYRHFADKSALLARVALEGFRIFRQALESAVAKARERDGDPLEEMGLAYLAFALANQSHYLTMFGGSFGAWDRYPELTIEADAAYNVLLNTVLAQQANSEMAVGYAPISLANLYWAALHGVATLGMAGLLAPHEDPVPDLAELVHLHSRIFKKGLRPE